MAMNELARCSVCGKETEDILHHDGDKDRCLKCHLDWWNEPLIQALANPMIRCVKCGSDRIGLFGCIDCE